LRGNNARKSQGGAAGYEDVPNYYRK